MNGLLIMLIPILLILYIIKSILKIKKEIIYIVFITILFLILAFQNNFGTDYKSYIDIFLEKKNYNPSKGVLFYYLYNILNKVTLNSRILFVTMAILNFIILIKIIRKLKKIRLIKDELVFLMVMVMTVYLSFFNALRASFAILCMTYSFILKEFFHDKKYIFYYLLGVGFHPSILIFFPFFFINNFLKKKVKTVRIILLMIIAYIFNIMRVIPFLSKKMYNVIPSSFQYRRYIIDEKVLNPYVTAYSDNIIYEILRNLGSFLMIVLVISFYIINHTKKRSINENYFYNIGAYALILNFLCQGVPIFMRVVEILGIFILIIKYKMIVEMWEKNFFCVGIFIFIFFYFIYIKNILTMIHF